LVPKKIYEKYECVCFHAAPLPYGRGGSPIQNLIKKKINKTPICALKMNGITDGGPIYGKKNVSLNGSLNEIFLRMSPIIQDLIQFISKNNPTPKNQKGKPYNFKRIKPVESSLLNKKNLFDIYDQIRMVDNEEYPRAFIKIGNYKIEFKEAQLKKNQIQAKVEIKKI
jgi:methionyl-tRNA formyltransferase